MKCCLASTVTDQFPVPFPSVQVGVIVGVTPAPPPAQCPDFGRFCRLCLSYCVEFVAISTWAVSWLLHRFSFCDSAQSWAFPVFQASVGGHGARKREKRETDIFSL